MNDEEAKILMVDGGGRQEETLRGTLLAKGYAVHVSRSEEESLSELATWRPDLVLLDISAVKQGGANFCREVRAKSRAQIIAFSTNKDPLLLIETLDAGADDFVSKPFSLAVIQARIRAGLR